MPTLTEEEFQDDRKVKELRTREILAKVEAKKARPNCHDCRWLVAMTHNNQLKAYCHQPWVSELDVNGAGTEIRGRQLTCSDARSDDRFCGPEGDVFQSKPSWKIWLNRAKIVSLSVALISTLLVILGLAGWGVVAFYHWAGWIWTIGIAAVIVLIGFVIWVSHD